jgi:hypothetical protein
MEAVASTGCEAAVNDDAPGSWSVRLASTCSYKGRDAAMRSLQTEARATHEVVSRLGDLKSLVVCQASRRI